MSDHHSIVAIEGCPFVRVEGSDEDLVRDVDLGRRAGLGRPDRIRKNFEALIAAGAFDSEVRTYKVQTSATGGRPGGIGYLHPAAMSLLHNCVAHPICGVLWLLGWDELADWIHDVTVPAEWRA